MEDRSGLATGFWRTTAAALVALWLVLALVALVRHRNRLGLAEIAVSLACVVMATAGLAAFRRGTYGTAAALVGVSTLCPAIGIGAEPTDPAILTSGARMVPLMAVYALLYLRYRSVQTRQRAEQSIHVDTAPTH
jgi:hypothetical protein